MADCKKRRAMWGKLRPIMRSPVTFRYEMKAQTPAAWWTYPFPHLHLHCHRFPTDKIFKGRELGVSAILVRPRVDSNLLSEQRFWEYDVSVAPGCLPSCTVTRNLGMKWTCSAPNWNVLTWILEAMVYASVTGCGVGLFLFSQILLHPSFVFQHSWRVPKKVWQSPEFIERAGASELPANTWDVQSWSPKMGSTA